MVNLLHIFSGILLFVGPSFSAKIIMFNAGGSASHKVMFYSIGEGLVKRGHEVTFYALFPPTRTIPGLKEIHIEDMYYAMKDKLEPRLLSPEGPIGLLEIMGNFSADTMEKMFELAANSKILKDLGNQKDAYDMALLDSSLQDLVLPYASYVAKSVVYINPMDLLSSIAWAFGSPFPMSYVPNVSFVPYSDEMTFLQRWINSFYGVLLIVLREWLLVGVIDKRLQEKMPMLPLAKEAEKDIAMVLVNRHIALDYPIPSVPSIKNVGGVHVRPPNPLPKDLEEFVSGSGNAGFIYMSFGTIVRDEDFPIYAKRAFIEAFAKIPQRVIWKFTLPIEGLSSNVMTIKHAPQQDLLGHKKARGFITHCGQHGLMEAVYHGVPMVSLAVTFDQPSNQNRANRMGICVPLTWDNVTTDGVLSAINSIINDQKYQNNVKKYQQMFRDNPISPLDEAVYWIEYVMRYPDCKHLRTAGEKLYFFQYYLLDVIAATSLAIFVFFYVVKKLVCLLCGCCKSKDKKKKD